MRAAVAILSDGFGQALGASRLIRNASLYVGLLFVLLAGGGLLAELGQLTWSDGLQAAAETASGTAREAADRSSLILVFGVAMCLVVVVDGMAVGMTLLASRMIGTPLGLRSAIQRARQVFWRLVGASLAVAILELVASAIYQYVLGIHQPSTAGMARYTVDAIPGTLVSIPFVLTTAGIVIADDSIGGALTRSARLARRSLPIAVALALFGIAFGYIGGVAIDQGSGLLFQATSAIHLDVRASGLSFLLAAILGLAIISAFGSILFTVGAVISAAQATAFLRFGMPLAGVMRVTPTAMTAPAGAPILADAPMTGMAGVAPVAEGPLSAAALAVDPPSTAEPATAPISAPVESAWAAAGRPTSSNWEAWASRAEPADPLGTRWVSIPMRVIGGFLWIAAVFSVIAGPPH